MKKRGLGRNLNALLSRNSIVQTNPNLPVNSANTPAVVTNTQSGTSHADNNLRYLPTELLQRGRYQPRKDIAPEAVQELADSIRAQGIIQPIVVRAIAQGRYEIIAGERRWRAAQVAGLTEVPTIIKEISDENTLAVALIENIQREDLNPLEEAIALQRLADEFGLTHQQVAEAVGKSRTAVTNLLRLLSLQSDVKVLLEKQVIEMGHARALLALSGVHQTQAARIVADKGLTVRQTEELVRSWQTSAKKSSAGKQTDPNIYNLQKSLSDKFGVPINFQHTAKGKGKLIIHYNNLDELDGILQRIK